MNSNKKSTLVTGLVTAIISALVGGVIALSIDGANSDTKGSSGTQVSNTKASKKAEKNRCTGLLQ